MQENPSYSFTVDLQVYDHYQLMNSFQFSLFYYLMLFLFLTLGVYVMLYVFHYLHKLITPYDCAPVLRFQPTYAILFYPMM